MQGFASRTGACPAKYVTLVTKMRCPTCGTENSPDSRFCGGCGARFSVPNQRVAPTHKITDDASFPQRPPGAAMPVTAPGMGPPRMTSGGAPGGGSVVGSTVRPVTPLPDVVIGPGHGAPYAATPLPRVPSAAPPASGPRAAMREDPTREDPAREDPARSLLIAARRPWGRIALVLVIDTVLALGGIYLLREGLTGAPAIRTSAPSPRPQ